MAVGRQLNALGQERLDVHMLRAIESGVAYDFDVVAGSLVADDQPIVVRGFSILAAGAVGRAAESLALHVAGSILISVKASESGSVLQVPSDRPDEILTGLNPRVSGGFTPGVSNYVALDLRRTADASTTDVAAFLDDDSGNEVYDEVPLARTLDYVIVIGTSAFAATPGLVPIAVVVTGATNKVTSIQDARQMFGRLSAPYAWPGTRNELTSPNASIGGDRALTGLKSWMDAVMTRTWEIGGGEFWYSQTADRNVQLASDVVFGSTGEPYQVVSGNVMWQGLTFTFDNSTAYVNEVTDQATASPGLTDLADGECIFVDLDRAQNRTAALTNQLRAQKGTLRTLGTSSPPGSRFVFAWRVGNGYYFRGLNSLKGRAALASTTTAGLIRTTIDPPGSGWDLTDPVAAGVAMTAAAGYAVTAGGLSHNRDLGTSVLPGVGGDVVVGRGTGAGDQRVLLTASGPNFVKVQAAPIARSFDGNNKFGALDVSTGAADDSGHVNLALSIHDASTQLRASIDAGGAIGMAGYAATPLAPDLRSQDLVRQKVFARPSKAFHPSLNTVAAATVSSLSVTTLGVGPTKSLTANANGAIIIDGVSIALGARVLVWWQTNPIDNGIYTVTDTGSGSSPWVMVRSPTFAGVQQLLGPHETRWPLAARGVTVKVLGGNQYGNMFFAASNASKPGEHMIYIDEEGIAWTRVSRWTSEQTCAVSVVGTGSITALWSSQSYDGLTAAFSWGVTP